MFKVLQSSTCTKACPNCPNVRRNQTNCDGHSACVGYGTTPNCPPLVVLAVVEAALRSLAAATLPSFGSMSSCYSLSKNYRTARA